ncbi:hypothetical protein GLP59_01960 [Sulfitobacter sp. M220]|jgi:hypothetical protein|uniref:hypothetical protein n=1 Tax=Roseobacteraceae TaxID=2854170 RepID=UPI001EEF9245|nr:MULTISPECIES: hypothetical protein [unclassified Sulfitobacter]MCF7727949.1 hypothetical protein [Sulfitobacter sp. M22]MCF7776427.1 hypothetical protein [Sulfitobacter sp. M220]|tara:strand:+ start:2572 stop:3006 length:435 start_codon:yes stop_codon:yes gene_type:complete
MPSGQEIGRRNFALFSAWVSEREARGDHADYIYRGKLSRKEIAIELGFNPRAFGQNPAIKSLIEALDKRWGSEQPVNLRSAAEESAARERANERVKRTEASNSNLLQRIATLEEENRQLRRELEETKQFKSARDAFLETTKGFR